MLKSFRADNFKSLVNLTFEPCGLNLLLGQNNAGKTNLCHAMRFLSLTSKMSLESAAEICTGEPWNLANAYLDKPTIDFALRAVAEKAGSKYEYEYQLSIKAPRFDKQRRQTSRLEVASEKLFINGGKFKNTLLMENNAGTVKLLHEPVFLGEQKGLPQVVTHAPTDHTMLFRLYDLQTNQRANAFKRYLGSWQYYNFDALQLRQSLARPLDVELEWSGSNLSSILYSLKSSDERRYRKILEAAKIIEPKLDLINFQAPDPEHVYLFFEDEKGKRFSVQNISDGTLRFLALCTVIVTNRAGTGDDFGPPVVMIEEPENGIYVGYLKQLFEKLEPSGQDGQFIFSTHAPYFIDLFDANLGGIWVMKNLKTHSSIEKPSEEKLKTNLGQFSLGEMHFRGLLL